MKKLALNLCLIFFVYSCLVVAGNTLINFCTADSEVAQTASVVDFLPFK